MKSRMLLSLVTLHVAFFALAAFGFPMHHQLQPRQSSDGCGPNPLVAVIAYAREFADFSPQQLMRFIEADTRAGSQLRTLLRAYDDCVRTGDGTRYKKSGAIQYLEEAPFEDLGSHSNLHSSLEQVNKSLLRALGDQTRPSSLSAKAYQ